MKNNSEEFKNRLKDLEKENRILRKDYAEKSRNISVIVPPELQPLFDIAQKTVGDYFTNLKMDPGTGTIEINDQRYLLVRASALSKDFSIQSAIFILTEVKQKHY